MLGPKPQNILKRNDGHVGNGLKREPDEKPLNSVSVTRCIASDEIFLTFCGTPVPTLRRIIVMRAGVDDTIWRVVVREEALE